MENNKLSKMERLAGRKRIEKLFTEGRSGFVYPFRYLFTVTDAPSGQSGVSMMVSVPKKHHKRAVKRNKLKRRTREAYRVSKHALVRKASATEKQIDLAMLYITKETEDFNVISNATAKILAQVAEGL